MIPVIILAIEDEDSRAFMVRLYEDNIARILYEARKRFPRSEDAEDAAYETVARLVNKVDLLRELKEPQRQAYILTTIRHISINRHMRHSDWREVSLNVLEDFISEPEGETSDESLLREQRNARLREILKTLDPEDRIVLEQRYLLQYSIDEIAKDAGILPNSARMRLTRAKRRLADAMLTQGFRIEDWT